MLAIYFSFFSYAANVSFPSTPSPSSSPSPPSLLSPVLSSPPHLYCQLGILPNNFMQGKCFPLAQRPGRPDTDRVPNPTFIPFVMCHDFLERTLADHVREEELDAGDLNG